MEKNEELESEINKLKEENEQIKNSEKSLKEQVELKEKEIIEIQIKLKELKSKQPDEFV